MSRRIKSYLRSVIFLKDYANKKEGSEMKCAADQAARLIQKGVAEYSAPVEYAEKKRVKQKEKPIVKKPKKKSLKNSKKK